MDNMIKDSYPNWVKDDEKIGEQSSKTKKSGGR